MKFRAHVGRVGQLATAASVGQVVSYGLFIVLARRIGVSAFKDYAVAVGAVTLLTAFTTVGLEKYAMRILPVFYERGDWTGARGSPAGPPIRAICLVRNDAHLGGVDMRINVSSVLCRSRVASKQILIAVMLLGFVAANATADDLVRRWDLDETPYAERNFIAKVGSNVRDGTVGLVDSLAQGLMSAVSLFNPRSGGVALQKVATFGGDVVGLIDNNPVTRHVFKGIVSRQLLRFGAGAQNSPQAIAFVHDTKFVDMPEMGPEDYVGDRAFHVRAYGRPSILVSLGGIVVSDFLVRPAGNLLMIFGMRETGESMDQWGKGLIEKSMRVPFL